MALALYQPEPTIPLDYEIRFNPDLTWGEKLFFAEVKSLCSKGICHYHQAKLAEMFDVSTMAISNWVKKLSNLGYIEIIVDVNDPECKMHIKVKK